MRLRVEHDQWKPALGQSNQRRVIKTSRARRNQGNIDVAGLDRIMKLPCREAMPLHSKMRALEFWQKPLRVEVRADQNPKSWRAHRTTPA
jgi:hypothetical protein